MTADELYRAHRNKVFVGTDRLFGGLMVFQYLAGIVVALWLSPRTYDGAESTVHPHVQAALLLGALISLPPVMLALFVPGRAMTRYVISVCQALSSALLIHLSGGRIETHFHVFGSLAFLAFYRDWKVLVPATLVTAADHLLRGVYFPQSVFGVVVESNWRWLEHAGWVLFEDIFLVGSCVAMTREMRNTAARTADAFRENRVLQAIRGTALDCVIGMDHEGRITEFNAAAERTFGYTQRDVRGRQLADVIVPSKFRELHKAGLDAFLRTGAGPVLNKRIEVVAQRADGSEFPVELAITAVQLDGPPIFIAYLRDITDRKNFEQQAKHAEMLALVASRTDNAVIITDPQGRIEWVNEGFTRVTGYDPAEVIGRKPGSFLQGPETDRETVSRIREHIRLGEGFTAEIVNYGKSGRKYWLSIEVRPVHGADGTLRHFMAIESDITARKLMEDELHQSRERFEVAVRGSSDGLWDWDIVSGEVYFSPTFHEQVGYADGELEPTLAAFERLVHPDDVTRVKQAILDAHERRAPIYRTEFRLRHRAGHYIWILSRGVTLHDAQGSPIRMAGSHTDITEQRQAAEALRQAKDEAEQARNAAEAASVAKSQFLANMSHEIRTPLNGVIGIADLMIRKGGLTDQQLRYANVIKSSGDSLLSLINDILDFSKIEAGKLELSPVDFDLRSAVEDVVEMLAPKAEAKRLSLASHVARTVPARLVGDPDRLRQNLVNLVNNAIKFTESGDVLIKTCVQSQDATHAVLKFTVQDTGVGIPKERLDRLFKSFSQVDASTTRKYGGTGLGLAIVKQLAALMGGDVGVDSTPGEGSSFWFTARLEVVQRPAGEPANRSDLAAALRGLRVLVVDDQPTYLEVVREQLAAWDLDVDTSTSTEEAMLKLRTAAQNGKAYRVALVDLVMPPGDSAAFLRRTTGDAELAGTTFMLMTSMDTSAGEQLTRELRLPACLSKPIRQSTLLDSLANAVVGKLAAAPAVSPVRVDQVGKMRAHVLLAEDNEVNQEVAGGIITDAGCTVEIVGNGAAALAACLDRSKRFDIVLMDCQMPEMDGFEATRHIRATMGPGLPIIALTANAIAGDRERCIAAGMNDYVAKPVDPEVLLETMRRLLKSAALREVAEPSTIVAGAAQPRGPVSGAGQAGLPDQAVTPIDGPALLRRCRGKADLAERLLTMFAGSVDKQLADLKAALVGAQWESFTRLAHTIKGTGANLAANPVSAVAAELERLGKVADVEAAEAALARLEREVKQCVAFIPAVLARPGEAQAPTTI